MALNMNQTKLDAYNKTTALGKGIKPRYLRYSDAKLARGGTIKRGNRGRAFGSSASFAKMPQGTVFKASL